MGLNFGSTAAEKAAASAPTGQSNFQMSGLSQTDITPPFPVFMDGGWKDTIPQGLAYYIDDWHVLHAGVAYDSSGAETSDVSKAAKVWFPDMTDERTGTAKLQFGWSDPEWAKTHTTEDTYQGAAGSLNGVKVAPGSMGFSVNVGDLPGISTAKTGRDNGAYADHSGGFLGGFGGLVLGMAAMAFGQPELAGWLAGGTATVGSSIAAGAIIGGATSAIEGGDPLKGAVLGGISGGVSSSGIGNAASNAVDTATNGAVDALGNVASSAIKYGVNGAITGAAAGVLSGGGFTTVLTDAEKGAVAGATGGAFKGGLMDAGVTNQTVLAAGGKVGSTLANQAMTDTPDQTTTPSTTNTVTAPKTTTSGVGFSSLLPVFQPPQRADMNWGSRLAGT